MSTYSAKGAGRSGAIFGHKIAGTDDIHDELPRGRHSYGVASTDTSIMKHQQEQKKQTPPLHWKKITYDAPNIIYVSLFLSPNQCTTVPRTILLSVLHHNHLLYVQLLASSNPVPPWSGVSTPRCNQQASPSLLRLLPNWTKQLESKRALPSPFPPADPPRAPPSCPFLSFLFLGLLPASTYISHSPRQSRKCALLRDMLENGETPLLSLTHCHMVTTGSSFPHADRNPQTEPQDLPHHYQQPPLYAAILHSPLLSSPLPPT